MANQQLVDYIRKHLRAGHNAETLRSHLVGHGYPLREVDEAIEAATRPVQKPALVAAKPALQKVQAKSADIASLFKTWFISLVTPAEIFHKERDAADFSNGFRNILISGIIAAFISGAFLIVKTIKAPSFAFSGSFMQTLGAVPILGKVITTPITAIFVWLALSAFFYLFVLLLGGSGSFRAHSYVLSIYLAPVFIIFAVFDIIPWLCVSTIASLALGFFTFFPLTFAMREVHRFDTLKAVLVWLIPVIIIVVAMLPVLKTVMTAFTTLC